MFPTIGIPQNGFFIMESPIKMDDLGVPLFSETPILVSFCQSLSESDGFSHVANIIHIMGCLYLEVFPNK